MEYQVGKDWEKNCHVPSEDKQITLNNKSGCNYENGFFACSSKITGKIKGDFVSRNTVYATKRRVCKIRIYFISLNNEKSVGV